MAIPAMSPHEEFNKAVLITGCSPGSIGHSLALEFHSRKYCVYATARLTNPESIASLHSQVQRSVDGHGLDILINNAGKDCIMPPLDLDINEAREMFEVNLFSVMSICQTFAPILSEQRGES